MRYLLGGLLLLSACASATPILANESGITFDVSNVGFTAQEELKAADEAEAHCAQYGKIAKLAVVSDLTRKNSGIYSFECVDP